MSQPARTSTDTSDTIDTSATIKQYIRTLPDFPKPGIQFRDVTTLLLDSRGFALAVEQLVAPYRDARVATVAGVEARGFILGSVVAHQLGAGFLPVRKPGKLPGEVLGFDYDLEYGSDRVEIHADAIRPGDRILLVDDLIATGGTAEAAVRLIEAARGDLVGAAFVVDLPDLGGRRRLEARGVAVHTLCEFEGD